MVIAELLIRGEPDANVIKPRANQSYSALLDQLVRVFDHLLVDQALQYDTVVRLHILKLDAVTNESGF